MAMGSLIAGIDDATRSCDACTTHKRITNQYLLRRRVRREYHKRALEQMPMHALWADILIDYLMAVLCWTK